MMWNEKIAYESLSMTVRFLISYVVAGMLMAFIMIPLLASRNPDSEGSIVFFVIAQLVHVYAGMYMALSWYALSKQK